MTDGAVRQLGRGADLEAQVAHLHALLRSGRLTRVHLEMIAWCGYEPARVLTPEVNPDDIPEWVGSKAKVWAFRLWQYGGYQHLDVVNTALQSVRLDCGEHPHKLLNGYIQHYMGIEPCGASMWEICEASDVGKCRAIAERAVIEHRLRVAGG